MAGTRKRKRPARKRARKTSKRKGWDRRKPCRTRKDRRRSCAPKRRARKSRVRKATRRTTRARKAPRRKTARRTTRAHHKTGHVVTSKSGKRYKKTASGHWSRLK